MFHAKKHHPARRALDSVHQALRRQLQAGAVMLLGEGQEPPAPPPGLSTGIPAFDVLIGDGGLPRRRVTELFGASQTGRTTLGLRAAVSAQADGGAVAFVDAEGTLDLRYAASLGVDLERFILIRPLLGEEVFDACEVLLRTDCVRLIVIDSVAALASAAELAQAAGEDATGMQARMLSQGLRRIVPALSRSEAALLMLNQTRWKLDAVPAPAPVAAGGTALTFYASLRVRLLDGAAPGAVRARVIKSKRGSAGQEATFPLQEPTPVPALRSAA